MTPPIEWIRAPSSGILHVAGEGAPIREVNPGTRLLCGWVLNAKKAKAEDLVGSNDERIGRKCKGCARWLRKLGLDPGGDKP